MFNKSNFCHVASNNRNEQKAGIFVYKTTDDLATVLTSGYFNEKIIDINLHDLIIHEWHDPTDRTNVQTNWLCVTERTLDNVGTKLVGQPDMSEYVKIDGSSIMTGPLKFNPACGIKLGPSNDGITVLGWMGSAFHITGSAAYPNSTYTNYDLGTSLNTFRTVYTNSIARYGSLSIRLPLVGSSNEVLALKSQVDDAANSGEQLYTTGVWYAKMYSATTVPAEAEVEGRNYADFSQVDQNNKPIIVVYTYTSGAWATTATITPPANHNGYMTITSKIWDIAEQAGQEGGKVLWSHTNKTFTPYPLIISFNDITVTGNSTVNMPQNPVSNQIANVQFVLDHAGSGGGSSNDLFDRKWTDYELNNPAWRRADNFQWIDGTEYTEAYNHLAADLNISFGTGWDITPATIGADSVSCAVWDGTNFIAITNGGQISTSTDGQTWTTPVSTLGNYLWTSVAYNGTMYVAISATGTVAISTDGTTWTEYSNTLGNYAWRAIATDGTTFVALSYDGRISRSTDGTTWTTASKVANLGENNWGALVWDGVRYVALSRTGYMSNSSDGSSWFLALPVHNVGDVLGDDDIWAGFAYTGTYYVALSQNGYITQSTNYSGGWAEPVQSADLATAYACYALCANTSIMVAFGNQGFTGTHSTVLLTPQTETVAGTTITYYRASDGHKICLDDQESNVEAIYTATGKAWYYIVDTTNHQFKLPRSKKNGYATSLGVYGNGMTLGLTNATLELGLTNSLLNYNHIYAVDNASGTNAGATIASGGNQADNYQALGITTDPTKSGMTTTEIGQDDDQNKFLYFYLGQPEE